VYIYIRIINQKCKLFSVLVTIFSHEGQQDGVLRQMVVFGLWLVAASDLKKARNNNHGLNYKKKEKLYLVPLQ